MGNVTCLWQISHQSLFKLNEKKLKTVNKSNLNRLERLPTNK